MPAPAPVAVPTGRRRGGGTARDIVTSLAVLAAVIVGYLLISGLWQNIRIGAGRPVGPTADIAASAAAGSATAAFPLLVPRNLPPRWRGTAATLRGSGQWHVGLVSPSGRFAALDQTAGPGTTVLRDALPARRGTGSVRLASGSWQRFTAAATPEGLARAGLVQRRGITTVVVSGTADPDELRVLAGSLTPVNRSPGG